MLKRLTLWAIVTAMILVGTYAQVPPGINSGGMLLLHLALLESDDDDDDDDDDGDDSKNRRLARQSTHDDDDDDDDGDRQSRRYTRRDHDDDDDDGDRKKRRRTRRGRDDDNNDNKKNRRRARRGNDNNTPQTPQPSQGNCPCNLEVAAQTQQAQILKTPNVTACAPGTVGPNTCFTCSLVDASGSSTYLSLSVDLWTNNSSSNGDSFFFFTTDPSSPAGGTCGADVSFASGSSFTTEGGQLQVTSEEFSACVSEIEALKSSYILLCSQ